MSDAALARRGFLRSLVTLPMPGGGVALLGAPTAIAEPITPELLSSYKTWLSFEHKRLSYELAGFDKDRARETERFLQVDNAGFNWHFDQTSWENGGWQSATLQPSSRAALILSAVGCDWRG
jgi:hypothetical protein